MTSRQAAEALGVSLTTVQLWTDNGLLSSWTTAGGHRRISRSSVDAILSRQNAALSTDAAANHPVIPDCGTLETPCNVLVVEDLQEQRRLYEKQFSARKLPVNLLLAKNGYEGLLQIGHHSPQVIITDLLMPNMDGFQMIQALKEASYLEKSLLVIVSGLTLDEIDARGGVPENAVYLGKPIPFDQLEVLIRNHLGKN